ncbi:MAG TPA: hypothetical protein VMR25_20215 [Planctomycetaceae bacterium]|nr:hypothetical protein [Planctomycetaceae bacterium]
MASGERGRLGRRGAGRWRPTAPPFLTAFSARLRSLFVVARLMALVAACGCHSSSESTRQTRAESISPAKGDDTALLASGGGGPGKSVVTTASDAAGSGSGNSPPAAQTASATSANSPWSKIFGHKESPDSLVLPRNDQQEENGALDGVSEKTAANEF